MCGQVGEGVSGGTGFLLPILWEAMVSLSITNHTRSTTTELCIMDTSMLDICQRCGARDDLLHFQYACPEVCFGMA